METCSSHHLVATESFSYSWLETEPNNNRLISYDHNQEAAHNFDFDVSISNSSSPSLVHADKLFSNGLIIPQSLHETRDSNATLISSFPSPSIFHNNAQIVRREITFGRVLLRKWIKFPRKIISKCVKCLIQRSRGNRRVDDVNRRTWEVNKSTPEVEVDSPKRNSGGANWSDTDESSIYEAILYCKRSSGVCS